MSTQVGFALPGYDSIQLVGRGGFSEVYSAYQVAFDRVVAIKVLHARPEAATMIDSELRVAAQMTEHPNIAQILDHGTDGEGRPYLVMPLYRESLADLISLKGRLDLETTLRLGVKLCGAIETLKQAGLLHRDIKPSNVLLNRFGDVVLCDFGIAQATSRSAEPGTVDNAFTAAYAAPEQLAGSEVGPPADVYSLGATLFACVAGRPPFDGPIFDVIRSVINGEHPALPDDVDAEFAGTVARAMDRSPERRPSALELGLALQALQRERRLPVAEMIIPDRRPGWETERDATAASPPPPMAAPPPLIAPTQPPPGPPPPSPGMQTPTVIPTNSVDGGRIAPPADAPPPYMQPPSMYRPMPPPAAGHRRRVGATIGRGLLNVFSVLAMLLLAPLRLLVIGGRALVTLFSRRRRVPGQARDSAMSIFSRVSADRPTKIDLLGHRPLMEGLAQVLNDSGTALPITIAVCGQWGAGKSSMMLQLADRLCVNPSPEWQRTWLAVRFDAWRFQGREALWAGLARAIYKQTSRSLGSPWKRLRFRVHLERLRRGWFRFYGGLLVLLIGATFVVISATSAWLGTTSWLTFAGLGAGAAALSAAVSYVGVISAPFERAIARGSVTKKFEEFLGISDQAETDIESLLSCIVDMHPERCLVVFLDDLDRCQAALITEALAAITEVFGRHDGRRIAFVLGIDIDVVTSAVGGSLSALQERMMKLNARRAAEMSDQFLEKVFQLSVAVDGHRRQQVERLLFGEDGSEEAPAVDTGRAAEVRERLAGLSVENPAEITGARRNAGIDSMQLSTPQLQAMRAAVRERRSSLLSVESADVRQAEQEAIATLRLTPRAAKRFDNAFRLQLQVANSTPGSQLTYELDSLITVAKWVAMRMFFQPIVRLLDQRPGLLGELEEILIREPDSSAFQARVRDLAPDLSAEAIGDAARLLRVRLPECQLARLPLESFATTTM